MSTFGFMNRFSGNGEIVSKKHLSTLDTYTKGKITLWRNNTRLAYMPDPASLVEVAGAPGQLNTWAAEVNTSSPWTYPKAGELDSMNFRHFIDQRVTLSNTCLVLTTACKAIFAAEPRQLYLLYVAALIAIKDGAQEKRVVGGTDLIPQTLAKKVGSEHIVLNAAVSTITKIPRDYKVVSRAGTVLAKEVVLAMAPPLLRQITFSPSLSTSRQQLNQEMEMASIEKGIPIYSTPFWRYENLSAQIHLFGAILGFILGDEMRALDKLTPAQCEEKLLADYKRYFGNSATNVTEFVLQRWDLEEWSRGGPVAVAPINVLTLYGSALRAKVDGLHFAGTETSPYWTGYMDGAIWGGERVAKEILQY
ncbi:monoamine oxidase [Alternaria panax]|uniref:Amine oxidase n=1 Tax=Alternaria panax TaxID=48097 RepID=A0AAD4NV31_9PLEO|nr:monoamine oxidase [Alternaria panax]